jgi:2,5-diketo-D-gluconate reductase A
MSKREPSAHDSREHRDLKDGGIDQRQQQIDPAGHHRRDLNAASKPTIKQTGEPDGVPNAPGPTRTAGSGDLVDEGGMVAGQKDHPAATAGWAQGAPGGPTGGEPGADASSTLMLRTGQRMPSLGLGTWELTDDTAGVIEAALERGYRMIDTACDYGSQRGIGEGLKRSGVDREDVFVVTKIEEDDTPLDAVRRDLDELALDHADLTLIHRPPAKGTGEALWEGLIRARDEGLVRDIGVSNYTGTLIDQLAQSLQETPVVNQVEWSPFGHSDDLLGHHRDRNIVLMAYSPLTRGDRLDNSRLTAIADRHGKSPAQVLVRWNLQRGTVSLPKANQISHVEENIDVFDFELSDDEVRQLDELNEKWSAIRGALAYA